MKRIKLIRNYVTGKSVLDLGCIQHNWRKHSTKNWLHKQLKNHAKKVVGVDYLKKDTAELRKIGYDIRYGDVENFDLGEKFDVILAGELIEHLANPGLFLASVKKHMNSNSKLIITTPNAFALGNIFRIIRRIWKFEEPDNAEHTCWYDAVTIKQLFDRNGLSIDKSYTFHPDRYVSPIYNLIPLTIRSRLFVVAKLK